MQVKKQQLEQDIEQGTKKKKKKEQGTGSILGKEYVKDVYS